MNFLSVLFLLYLAVVAALTVGMHYVTFIFGTAFFAVSALVLWVSCIKPRGLLPDKANWIYRDVPGRGFPLLYFVVIAGFSVLYWLAYFPGSFNLDAYGQWMQAHHSLQYNDWHPLTSTLIIQFIVSIVDRFEFYIGFQILVFSVAVAYLLSTLQAQKINPMLLTCVAIFIGVNPAIGLNTISLTKDVQFTIVLIFISSCAIKTIFSNGKWLDNYLHLLVLGALLGAAFLIKHNGAMYVLPFFLILLITYKPHILKVVLSGLLAAAIVLTIKFPISKMLNTEPHENVVGEAIGIPMAIMANALVNDADNIPADVHVFLNEIASDDEWQSHYYVGEWDSCKWEFGGTELLRDVSAVTVLRYAWETICSCPQASYESIRANTGIVWELLRTYPHWVPDAYIEPNEYEIESRPVIPLQEAFEFVKTVTLIPVLSIIFWNTGFHIAAILIVFCLSYRRIRAGKILLVIPLLVFELGTMLLLAGPNQRYFYCNAVLFLPIILSLLTRTDDEVPT